MPQMQEHSCALSRGRSPRHPGDGTAADALCRAAWPFRTLWQSSTARSAPRRPTICSPTGKTIRREPARHADRRRAEAADRITGRHPIDVGVHRHARDRARPLDLDGKRQHLHRGQHEKLVRREKLCEAGIERRLRACGTFEIGRRELEPPLDVPHDGVLELRSPALEVAAQRSRIARRAQRLKQLVDAVEVGLAVGYVATELRRENGARGVADRRHAGLHGVAAEALAPGDARAREIALRHVAKRRARLRQRQRVASVGPRHHRQAAARDRRRCAPSARARRACRRGARSNAARGPATAGTRPRCKSSRGCATSRPSPCRRRAAACRTRARRRLRRCCRRKSCVGRTGCAWRRTTH